MILIAKSLGYISKVSIFVCKLIIMLMNFLELVKAAILPANMPVVRLR